jgi:hypothetical protein
MPSINLAASGRMSSVQLTWRLTSGFVLDVYLPSSPSCLPELLTFPFLLSLSRTCLTLLLQLSWACSEVPERSNKIHFRLPLSSSGEELLQRGSEKCNQNQLVNASVTTAVVAVHSHGTRTSICIPTGSQASAFTVARTLPLPDHDDKKQRDP